MKGHNLFLLSLLLMISTGVFTMRAGDFQAQGEDLSGQINADQKSGGSPTETPEASATEQLGGEDSPPVDKGFFSLLKTRVCNVPSSIWGSMKNHPLQWFSGVVVVAAVISYIAYRLYENNQNKKSENLKSGRRFEGYQPSSLGS